jgi:uncharacterized protein
MMKLAALGLAAALLICENRAMAMSQLGFFELASSDLSRAKAFYSELFGWQFRDTSSADFIMIEGAGIPGGIIRDASTPAGRPNAKLFFKVEMLKTKLAQAEKLGAKILIQRTQVSPTSTIAEFRDLDQNVVGMICNVRCSE